MRSAEYPRPAACDRCREQLSLELDGELSEVERAMLRAHLRRCAVCHEFAERVTAVVRLLRTAALEHAETAPLVSPRPIRLLAMRLQAASAAVLAVAAVGLGSQLVALSPSRADTTDRVFQYPTRYQIDQEQAQVAAAVATHDDVKSTGVEEVR
jgi:predicted anti-sigma-YlaC factor YlaD